MTRRLSFLVLALFVLCAAPALAHSKEKKDWWKARDAHPLSFEVPAERADAVWSRALECVATFYPKDVTPITVANETLIQTDRPVGATYLSIVFTVVRSKLEAGGFRVTFSATSFSPLSTGQAKRLAKACSYYADLGIPEPE
jgi:hypothetical protein